MIVIIDNYDSFTYNLYQMLATFTQNVKVYRNDKITIETLEKLELSGIVISPGPGTPAGAGISMEVVQHFSGKMPILGVCLGHQAIAAAFGAKVVVNNQIVHGKPDLIFHNRSGIFANLPLPFAAGRYHSLVVAADSVNNNLKVIAHTANGTIMAVAHSEHPTFGVQFHPESILTAAGKQLLQNFLSICKEMDNNAVDYNQAAQQ